MARKSGVARQMARQGQRVLAVSIATASLAAAGLVGAQTASALACAGSRVPHGKITYKACIAVASDPFSGSKNFTLYGQGTNNSDTHKVVRLWGDFYVASRGKDDRPAGKWVRQQGEYFNTVRYAPRSGSTMLLGSGERGKDFCLKLVMRGNYQGSGTGPGRDSTVMTCQNSV